MDELASAALALVGQRSRVVLGIAGAPGAGKSTLVARLLRDLTAECGAHWVAHVPMDGFHLADAQLQRLGLRDRKGAPATFDAAGYAHCLRRVRSGEADVYVPGFERDLEQPLAAALVVPAAARLVITEGNYLLLDDERWHPVRAELDVVWFVTGPAQTRRDRLVRRHVEFGKAPETASAWVLGNDEPNAALVADSAARADRLVVNGPQGWRFAADG